MSHSDWEDLTEFLDGEEFATDGFFKTDAGTMAVTGIFDNAYLLAETGEVDLETTQPRFTCKAVDVLLVERGQEVTISGQLFSVLAVEPDGTGMAVVVLANE
ncbi:head-tail joining protein [Endozoicomonas acroporae]|uniref:head-tail joining protein n=1 Tax=Endozoicomonas acroporae TaxID=1701104 RepID=UPI0013D0FB28|nr:head-tail joining protein [Endozoicomonas acroporae]